MKPKTKKDLKKTIKNLKKSLQVIGKEWNKAVKELENFNPSANMEMPYFSQQMKDFNLDGKVRI